MATGRDRKQSVLTVWGTHDFVAENEDELAFCAGEAIEVLEKDDQYGDGWWLGRDSKGRVGLFPASFASELALGAEGQAGEQETSYSVSGTSEPQSGHSSLRLDRHDDVRDLMSSSPRRDGDEATDGAERIELASLVAAAIAAVRADGVSIPIDEEDEAKVAKANVPPTTLEGGTGREAKSLPETIRQEYGNIMREVGPPQQKRVAYPTVVPNPSKVAAVQGDRGWARLGIEEARRRSPTAKPKPPPLKTGRTDVVKAVENLAISHGKEADRQSAVDTIQHTKDRPATSVDVTYGSSLLGSGTFQPERVPAPQGHPKEWSIKDVFFWLKSRGFEAEASRFAENEITGAILLELDLTTLKELGVTSFGKRFNIMHAVADLKEEWDMSLVTPVASDSVAPSLSASLARGPETLDDSAVYVRTSGKTASTASGKSSVRSDDAVSLPRRDSVSRLPMQAKNTLASKELGRKPVSSFHVSVAETPEGGSTRPVKRVTRVGSVASRPAPMPPRIQTNKLASKPRDAGVNGPRQPTIPARHSSVPVAHERPPPAGLKAPISTSNPSSPVDSPAATGPSNSLRYLPKSEPSDAFDSQERVVDYHHIDGTKFFNDAEHSGWLYKQRGALKTWKRLFFSIKCGVLYYQKHRGDRRVVGRVELRGYKIVPDANIYRGKYCWKAKHDRLRTHFFYADEAEDMKAWLKHMIKATISLDPDAPVISSYAAKTVPINVAQEMQPRPPHVTDLPHIRSNNSSHPPSSKDWRSSMYT